MCYFFYKPSLFLWVFFVQDRKKKEHVTITNKVTLCDQKHKSNAVPVEVQLFRSSKPPEAAAPYSLSLILTRRPIKWQQNHKQAALPNQEQHTKNEAFCSPPKQPIRTNVQQDGGPMGLQPLSTGTTGWVEVEGKWVEGGGLIWGQSIDLPSLYLLPTHQAKINGEANSSPPWSGLVNTQLISHSLKLTSQLLTYWYRETRVGRTETVAHVDGFQHRAALKNDEERGENTYRTL